MPRLLPHQSNQFEGLDGKKSEFKKEGYLFRGQPDIIVGQLVYILLSRSFVCPLLARSLRKLDYISQSFFPKAAASEIIG